MQEIILFIKRNLKDFILGGLIIISLILSCYTFLNKQEIEPANEENNLIANNDENLEESNETKLIYVDVKGSVQKPGVYEVKEGIIINDIINLAGGFTKNASFENINLSKKAIDEMVIYVYSKDELKKISQSNTQNVYYSNCSAKNYDIKDCVEKKESIIITDNVISNEDNSNEIININTANKELLTTLSGIGDAKADAIIEYRNTNGNFKNIEELLNVNGIGDAVFAKIKDYITI